MKKVLIITASDRLKGNGGAVLDLCQKHLSNEPFEVKKIALKDYKIKTCTGCMKCIENKKFCHLNDDLKPLIDTILDSDILIIAVPVYFLGVSSIVKTITDRLLFMNVYIDKHSRKPSGIIVNAGRKDWEGNTTQQTSIFLYALGYYVKNVMYAHAHAPSGILLQDETIFERSKSFVNNLINIDESPSYPKKGCPICFTENFKVISKSTVKCSICDIEGQIIKDKNGEISVSFTNIDINNNRLSTHSLIDNLSEVQSWADSVNDKEELKNLIKKRRELLR